MSIDFANQLSSQFGIAASEIKGRDLQDVCQQWLQRFCPNVKCSTGRWVHGEYWWHAYSFNHEQAISGITAFEKYQSQPFEQFFVYRQFYDMMFDCTAMSWPDLRTLEDDIYVFPHAMTWAFLTTHEMSSGLGPYFAQPPNKPREDGQG
jgi:hypothetical protein